MKLTDAAIRKAKALDGKPIKLADGAGLYLQVTPAGGRHWRYRYEIQGREKLLALGSYPAVSLADARKAREAAREDLEAGHDPSVQKKIRRATAAQEAASTFEVVARAWHALYKPTWSERHATDVMRNLENDVFPALGSLPIRSITPKMVLTLMRDVEERSPTTARKMRQQISAVFVYAIAADLAETDPAQTIRGAMQPTGAVRHHPAVTSAQGVRDVLAKLDTIPAHPGTRLAARLLALTALRSKELRGATDDEFEGLDGPEPTWTVPAERMKGRKNKRRPHKVPLSRQAVEIVKAARALAGRQKYLFPAVRHSHRQMSETTLGQLLIRAGFEGVQTPHGFRSSFSTCMNELLANHHDRAVIDLMLAHKPTNHVEGIYNQAAYMARRREIAQQWADLITEGLVPPMDLLVLPRSGLGREG
ncbi:tyrosine-type recombinase/integrase [Roseomonas xinghualingensis]|uniref:tyrosine-type recombinase/integrase n=1 Tax=Roseomonas xinghualingensis TaxID=2986475 RepID=UPI0021F0F777|nr:integrase arm-type DNA-binding domain-containing protein [Roseomonas sp. SXEYE001]MCV4210019.1 integrase arm-type DNA-binding domain-containing protein [Roseomonas sp. SXEYE001]